ncbi:MAG: threonine synthase [Candidatus Velthaea sp.]
MKLLCSECRREAAATALFCADCGGLLGFEFERFPVDAATLRATLRERRTSNAHVDRSGVWRFRELLPPFALDEIVTLRENDVPIYAARRGASYAGIDRLSYLHLGMNPTGSFKDAGMTVALTHAAASGARIAVCASTGNTAAAMAAYAQRAGIRAIVLVPSTGISESKVAQTLDYGATVLGIEGDFDAALATVRRLDPQRVAIVNSVNPYRIEGQKTAAFVLLEQRNWNVPDWFVLPGGNLGNTSAFGKGFREAFALGLIDKLPRIAVIQASGAAPFARLFRDGGDLIPVKADTTATAIKIGAPASWRKALGEVRASGGLVTHVDDAAIADARAIIGADGIGCEPASAASLAGARTLVADGTIAPGDDVVLVLTGHVLKDSAYAANYHGSHAAFANAIVRTRDEADLFARIDALATA